MKHQVEVRNITKKISQLNTKLDTVNQLAEPRENSYIEFQRSDLHFQEVVQRMLADVGQIKTSKTFPSLCRVTMETSISNLESTARLQTIDYHGKIQVKNSKVCKKKKKKKTLFHSILKVDYGLCKLRSKITSSLLQ